jgi:hypothetical protein
MLCGRIVACLLFHLIARGVSATAHDKDTLVEGVYILNYLLTKVYLLGLNLFLRCWTEINHYPVKEKILISSSIVIDNKPLYSCVDVFSFGIGESFFKIA